MLLFNSFYGRLIMVLSACAIGILPGCVTTQSEMIGSGDLTLSARTERIFIQYLERSPMAFAVSLDGQNSGYYYCPEPTGCSDQQQTLYFAIEQCEQRSGGKTCKVFAIADQIVWNGYTKTVDDFSLGDPIDVMTLPLVSKDFEPNALQRDGLKQYKAALDRRGDLVGAVAVAPNGKLGWTAFPKTNPRTQEFVAIDTLDYCKAISKQDCMLLALHRTLVSTGKDISSAY